MQIMKDVVILGAGLSGLGCARRIPGARIFEASNHPGGHAFSHVQNGVAFDEGAHICHSKDQAWLDLLHGFPRKIGRIPFSRVENYWRGNWVAYPVQNHLYDLPAAERTKALDDFMASRKHAPEREPANYEEWCLFQYGRYLTGQFYAKYTAKYWRTPMSELATDWLSGRLMPSDIERIIAGARGPQPETQAVFAGFHYPARGGFFELIAPLYEGLDIAYNARAVQVDPARKIVRFEDGRQEAYDSLASSIPLPELAAMTGGLPDQLKQAASLLRHTQLLCVNMIVRRPDLSPCHWFYIYDEPYDAARVSLPGRLAPGSVPDGCCAIQAEVFRRHDEALDGPALVEKTVRDLAEVLHFNASTELAAVDSLRIPWAYVISDHARAGIVAALTTWYAERNIVSMGLHGAWKFIWSDAAFRSGERAAAQIGPS